MIWGDGDAIEVLKVTDKLSASQSLSFAASLFVSPGRQAECRSIPREYPSHSPCGLPEELFTLIIEYVIAEDCEDALTYDLGSESTMTSKNRDVRCSSLCSQIYSQRETRLKEQRAFRTGGSALSSHILDSVILPAVLEGFQLIQVQT